jgi:hypothetical protein
MNNDVMMINKEHETFQFTQLNNNIKIKWNINLFNYSIGYELPIKRFNEVII